MAACPTPEKEALTKGQAKAIVRDMRKRARRSKRKLNPVEPYECPAGGHYHLTTKRKAHFKVY